MTESLKRKIIIFGRGPATEIALISAKKLLNNFKVFYFYLENENRDFDNLSKCKNLNLRSFRVNSYKEFAEEVFKIYPLYILLTQCSLVIKKDVINLMGENIINLHHGNLPKYRGMGPITNAILAGEKIFGVSLHTVEEKIDTGKILEQKTFNISNLTNEEVYKLCIKYDQILINNLLSKINISQKLITFKQNERVASYFSKESLNYSNPIINFSQSSEKILRFCRAYFFPSKNLFPIIEVSNLKYYVLSLPKVGGKVNQPNLYRMDDEVKSLSISSNDRWLVFKKIKIKE